MAAPPLSLSLSRSLSPCPLLSHLEHEETRLHDARLEEKGPELLVAEVVKDEPRGPVVVGRRGAHQRAHRSATASPLAASSMTASTRRLLTKRLPSGLIEIMIALRFLRLRRLARLLRVGRSAALLHLRILFCTTTEGQLDVGLQRVVTLPPQHHPALLVRRKVPRRGVALLEEHGVGHVHPRPAPLRVLVLEVIVQVEGQAGGAVNAGRRPTVCAARSGDAVDHLRLPVGEPARGAGGARGGARGCSGTAGRRRRRGRTSPGVLLRVRRRCCCAGGDGVLSVREAARGRRD